MKRGHIPVRMCVGCRQRKPAMELIRLNALGDAVVVSCDGRTRSGRGCYACPTASCLDRALNKTVLKRALRRDISATPSREALLNERVRKEGVIG